jgi:hypothetical protein
MTKSLNYILLLGLFSSLILSGCIKKIIIYDFKSSEIKYEWGEVGGRLLGKKTETTFTVTSASPYELLIWFHSNELSKGIVEISEISLINAKTKRNILDQKKSMKLPFESNKKGVTAYYSIKNLKMEYENTLLEINYRLLCRRIYDPESLKIDYPAIPPQSFPAAPM